MSESTVNVLLDLGDPTDDPNALEDGFISDEGSISDEDSVENESYDEYSHPEDHSYEYHENTSYEYHEDSNNFFEDQLPAKPTCDSCDREFLDEAAFEKHMAEHTVCRIDGCTFTAHQKVVELHVKMQHATGLYEKIRTATPDADKKWLEERKRSFPCAGSTEKTDKREEMHKRGERLTRGNDRFGRNNRSRFERPSTKRNTKQNYKTKNRTQNRTRPRHTKKESLIDDKSDWNGKMFPFRGTGSLYEDEEIGSDDDFSDTEWNFTPTSSNQIIKPNNALGALMGAYNSSEESDQEIQPKKPEPQKVEPVVTKCDIMEKPIVEQSCDDEAPVEEKIVRRVPEDDVTPLVIDKGLHGPVSEKSGRKRKRVSNVTKKEDLREQRSNNLLRQKFRRRKRTLLEGLLENEIRHERNVLLQCVRYIVNNNFFS